MVSGMGTFVYFATIDKGAPVKIGFSGAPEKRVRDFQARLIAKFPGSSKDEHLLHKRFAHLNIYGEWFRCDPELEAFIALSDEGKAEFVTGVKKSLEKVPAAKKIALAKTPQEKRISKINAENPLSIWLARKDLRAWRFADEHKMPRRTIYTFITGENTNPRLKLMMAIQKITKGQVTITMISDWCRKISDAKRANIAAAKKTDGGVEDDFGGDDPEADEAEEPDHPIDDDAEDGVIGDAEP